MIERCLLFLRSDRAYAWPAWYSPRTENRRWFERLLGIGKERGKQQFENFKNAGDLDVWPFLSREEMNAEANTQST